MISADARTEACTPLPLEYVDQALPMKTKKKTKKGRGQGELQWNHPFKPEFIPNDQSTIKKRRRPGSPSMPRSKGPRRPSTSTVDHTSPPQRSDSGYGSVPQTPNNNTEVLAPHLPQQPSTLVSWSDNTTLLRDPSHDPINAYQTLLDATELVNLLAFLGGVEVHCKLLLRAKLYYSFFNRAGEVSEWGTLELIPVLTHDHRLASAIWNLERVGMITSEPGPLDSRRLKVPPNLRSYVEGCNAAGVVRQLKMKASKLICHTFPSSSDASPFK
jgi:hypothetical protein